LAGGGVPLPLPGEVPRPFSISFLHAAARDRSAVVHGVSLFDIASKYGDVMPTDAAIAAVNRG
jgi:hypothetical protein